MAGSTTPCIACGRTGGKMSNEDAYPIWLRDALGIVGPVELWADGVFIRQIWTLEAKVRIVCESCNSGWMERLESAFRARMYGTLTGSSTADLDQEGQERIATWAVKTWLMLEEAMRYVRDPGFGFAVAPMMHWMWEHESPPPTVQVFMGAVDAIPEQALGFLATQLVGSPPKPPNGVTGVFSIGCAVFQIYVPVTEPDRKGWDELGVGGGTKHFLTEIFPMRQEVAHWPPEGIFRNEDLDRLWPSHGYLKPGPPPKE